MFRKERKKETDAANARVTSLRQRPWFAGGRHKDGSAFTNEEEVAIKQMVKGQSHTAKSLKEMWEKGELVVFLKEYKVKRTIHEMELEDVEWDPVSKKMRVGGGSLVTSTAHADGAFPALASASDMARIGFAAAHCTGQPDELDEISKSTEISKSLVDTNSRALDSGMGDTGCGERQQDPATVQTDEADEAEARMVESGASSGDNQGIQADHETEQTVQNLVADEAKIRMEHTGIGMKGSGSDASSEGDGESQGIQADHVAVHTDQGSGADEEAEIRIVDTGIGVVVSDNDANQGIQAGHVEAQAEANEVYKGASDVYDNRHPLLGFVSRSCPPSVRAPVTFWQPSLRDPVCVGRFILTEQERSRARFQEFMERLKELGGKLLG